jgi:hypothetical protein
VLAATGQVADATTVDSTEGTHLRRQALDWLRADLALLAKATDRALVQRTLRQWQQDPYLASVRDPEALATLPLVERQGWATLWFDVAHRLQKSSGRE